MTVNGPSYTGLHVRDPSRSKANSINGDELKLLRTGNSWQLLGTDGKVESEFDLDTFSRGANGELELNKDNASKAELKKLKAFKSFKELTGREYGNIKARNALGEETTKPQDPFSNSNLSFQTSSVNPESINSGTKASHNFGYSQSEASSQVPILPLPDNLTINSRIFNPGSSTIWQGLGAQKPENTTPLPTEK
jgi:hypothetical protein